MLRVVFLDFFKNIEQRGRGRGREDEEEDEEDFV